MKIKDEGMEMKIIILHKIGSFNSQFCNFSSLWLVLYKKETWGNNEAIKDETSKQNPLKKYLKK